MEITTPFTCCKCGIEFIQAEGGMCSLCQKLFCISHLNIIKIDDTNRQIPIRVIIFNTRLAKLQHFLGDQNSADAQRIIKDLRSDIADIPLASFSVHKVYHEVQDAWQNNF